MFHREQYRFYLTTSESDSSATVPSVSQTTHRNRAGAHRREQSHGNFHRDSVPREYTFWTVKWAAIRSELLAHPDGGGQKTGGKRPVGPASSSPFTLNWCSIGGTWCLEVNYKVVERLGLPAAKSEGTCLQVLLKQTMQRSFILLSWPLYVCLLSKPSHCYFPSPKSTL